LHLSVWQLQTVATADPIVIMLQLFVARPTPQSRLLTEKIMIFIEIIQQRRNSFP
jgi:hypothetical protein